MVEGSPRMTGDYAAPPRKTPLFSRNFCDKAVYRSSRLSVINAFIGLFLSLALPKDAEGTIAYIIIDSLLLTNLFVLIGAVLVMAIFTMYAVKTHM